MVVLCGSFYDTFLGKRFQPRLVAGRVCHLAGGLGVFFALRNLPAHGATAVVEDPVQPSGGAEASLGFADSKTVATGRAGETPRTKPPRVQVERRHSTLRLTGSLTADEQSDVASNVTGMVAEVRVDRGSVVEKATCSSNSIPPTRKTT